MKYCYLLLFYTLIFTSCQRGPFQKTFIEDDNRFTIVKDIYNGASYLDTLYYDTGEIKAIGTFAVDNYADTSFIKVRHWREYFANGKLKEEGSYQLGSYLQCSSGGYFRMYYNYKKGPWKYWYENGQLKAQGTYITVAQHFQTSCKGGNQVGVHKVDSTWHCFDEKGKAATVTEEWIKELEEVDLYRLTN